MTDLELGVVLGAAARVGLVDWIFVETIVGVDLVLCELGVVAIVAMESLVVIIGDAAHGHRLIAFMKMPLRLTSSTLWYSHGRNRYTPCSE